MLVCVEQSVYQPMGHQGVELSLHHAYAADGTHNSACRALLVCVAPANKQLRCRPPAPPAPHLACRHASLLQLAGRPLTTGCVQAVQRPAHEAANVGQRQPRGGAALQQQGGHLQHAQALGAQRGQLPAQQLNVSLAAQGKAAAVQRQRSTTQPAA
jgi:hypothetical protein